MADEGQPIHYSAVERGTPVFSSDGIEVGTVDQVVDNYREHILDGFVIETSEGKRFADAPEVGRTTDRSVTLTIEAAAVSALPEPDRGAPSFKPNRGGRLSRLFGGGWRKH
jgi:sporulation protein YlmC with PRC-barrel domain